MQDSLKMVNSSSQCIFENEIDEKDLTFWIDPLDGSKGLSEGYYTHLTCMIGISVKNRPKFGIIHKLFNEENDLDNGRTYIGIPGTGLYIVQNQFDR